MISKHYKDVQPESIEDEPGLTVRWLITGADGAPGFAMRYMTVAPGASSPHHRHSWEHEVYVLGGEGVVRSEAGDSRVKPGCAVYIEPDELHQFVNQGEQPLTFL